MPLLSVDSVGQQARLGLWRISESLDDIFELYPCLLSVRDEVFSTYSASRRRLEVLVVRLLLREMEGDGVLLSHDDDGRPSLSNGHSVSVSHTKGYAAVIISPERGVAVDVERLSDKVGRLTSRFMRDDETAATLAVQTLHWCAKETLYKLYPDDKLALTEARVVAVKGDDFSGFIIAENARRSESVKLSYRVFDDTALTYTVV